MLNKLINFPLKEQFFSVEPEHFTGNTTDEEALIKQYGISFDSYLKGGTKNLPALHAANEAILSLVKSKKSEIDSIIKSLKDKSKVIDKKTKELQTIQNEKKQLIKSGDIINKKVTYDKKYQDVKVTEEKDKINILILYFSIIVLLLILIGVCYWRVKGNDSINLRNIVTSSNNRSNNNRSSNNRNNNRNNSNNSNNRNVSSSLGGF